MTGLHLSHYAIDAELGRGGMGVVYRATDTKLNRTVALKVLPAAALASPDDRARFVREAQSAGQLNHPNIATVYGIDEAVPEGDGAGGESRLFIAMEYIHGETLRHHAQKRPMPLQQAVRIAGQVAEALKEAHAKDIVHRDIKSANIMLTDSGVAKVLDFGLAKTTASTMLTRMGSTLGTVAYMSPEQARGEEVDGRSDLYSLGTVLYEMISGRLPFPGDYEQAVLYGILNEDPEPLTAIRTGVPMQLEWIVNKLLAKEARHRYQTAGDLIADLETVDLTGSGFSRQSMPAVSSVPPERTGKTPPAWWMVGAALALGLVAAWLLRPIPEAPASPTLKLSVNTGSVEVLGHARVSPDLAYVAFHGEDTTNSDRGIFIYESATREMRYVPESADYQWPTYSSDGRWLVVADIRNGIAKLPVAGGRPVHFHDGIFRGWFGADEIFVADGRGLATIDMNGSPTGRSYQADTSMGYEGLFAPKTLPGGRSLVMEANRVSGADSDLVLMDVRDGSMRTLVSGASMPKYVDSGHLLYFVGEGFSEQEILAQPFDPRSGELIGDAVPLGVQGSIQSFGVAPGGVITRAGPRRSVAARSIPTWVDIEGGGRSVMELARAEFGRPSFSFSGDFLAVSVTNPGEDTRDVVVVDLATGLDTRRTFEGDSQNPVWSFDDAWVYYSAARGSRSQVYRRRADGSGEEEPVTAAPEFSFAFAPHLSADGKWVTFQGANQDGSGVDIVVISVDDTSNTWRAGRDGIQTAPALSPDGTYVAFYTTENRRPGEIYVQAVGGEASFVVSRPGEQVFSTRVAWSSDGSWLYYGNHRGEIRRARVSLEPVFRVEGHETVATGVGLADFALHPDGDRLLVFVPEATEDQKRHFSIDITLNVQTELSRIAPPRR